MSDTAVLEAPQQAQTSVPTPPPTPAKLVRPRDEAIGHMQTQIKSGSDIKAMRIRNPQELDQARTVKLEWTSRTAELLNTLFDNPSVAEQCNDWVGRIYPEYAEFGNFVEQFYAEMDHRLSRLKAVLRGLEKLPASGRAAVAIAMAGAVPPAVPQAAAVGAPAGTVMEAPSLQNLAGLLVLRKADPNCRQGVAEFLESLGIDVAIAEETRDMADHLDRNRDVQFAVVLSGDGQLEHYFELGFCAGRLGTDRVLLLNANVEAAQTDTHGLTRIALDNGGGWQLQLARHLKRAGLPVDLNRLC